MGPIHDLVNKEDSEKTVSTLNSLKKQDGKEEEASFLTVSSKSSKSSTSNTDIDLLFPEIDKDELTRLIIQTLGDLGYNASSELLKQESGLELDSPTINKFIAHVQKGDFISAESDIDGLELIDGSDVNKQRIMFLIKRQKFLETLYHDDGYTQEALKILRNEINELTTIQNIRSLTSLLMNKDSEQLQRNNGWINNSVESSRTFLLNEISKFINPHEMIPKFRLFKLLQQSIQLQRSLNLYQFGDNDGKVSLYENIKSDKTNFPDTVTKTLNDHQDEAWYTLFSHDGTKLVTTSADNLIYIYDVYNDFKLLKKLVGHGKQVMYASFSPDDSKLLTCSIESKARLWDVESGETEHIISLTEESRIWCADWFPNGEFFVLGSPDKEISLFNTSTAELVYKWKGPIINDLKITSSYKLIAATYNKTIEIWDLHSKNKIKTIDIGERITSVSISQENPNHILLNVCPNELQLWDWNRKILLSKYVGHKQEKYIIRSAFGYFEKLIASGSEDGRVFIWNKEFGALLGAFEAHKGNCNCVSWHPKIKSMFVTCGDDGLVKIWGPSSKRTHGSEGEDDHEDDHPNLNEDLYENTTN